MAENEILNQEAVSENTENQEVTVPEVANDSTAEKPKKAATKKAATPKPTSDDATKEEDSTEKKSVKKAAGTTKTAKTKNVEGEKTEEIKPKRTKKSEAIADDPQEKPNSKETVETEAVSEPSIEPEAETEIDVSMPNISDEDPTVEAVEETEDLVVEKEADENEEAIAENFDKDLQNAKTTETTDNNEEEEKETFVEQIPDYQDCTPDALITALDELIHNEPFEQIRGRVAAIKIAFLNHEKKVKEADKQAFLEAGGNIEEYVEKPSEEAERFFATFDLYKEKKAEFQEAFEKQKEENLKRKNEILEELKELLSSDKSLKVTYDRFRELQEEWKNTGIVPKTEIAMLWNNYHFLIEKFFQKVRISRELKDLDLKKNLDAKISLCEKAEELLIEQNPLEAFRKLQEYHKQWKELGQVPYANREEIWERFKTVTDKVNQSRREHYDSMRDSQQANYEAKVAICDKVEEIVNGVYNSFNEWTKQSAALDELFKLWKTVGSASKKQNDEIWTRFRELMNTFYNAKREYFVKIKDQHQNNYNLKVNLCLEAEALQDSTNWGKTTQDLIRLQNEWKQIGPVPGKHSEKIWKRFRSACDTFFNKKDQFFSTRTDTEQANLKAKQDLIEEIKSYATDDKSEALNKLKEFQRRWVEIGFVPFKEKDKLQTAYRTALNEQMEKLNISSVEVSAMEYKNRIEGLSGLPDGDKTIRKEIMFLQSKIAQMQDDINLLENNIGFLANSKNADILKKEFEKKIEKAKSELTLNTTKLQYLRRELLKDQDNNKKK
ncbi:MAG: DUF349 domain-containing protein [Bacteroidales bacterium]|nr:DUF349 domain-containing protein [Bacteroidales bacterium]